MTYAPEEYIKEMTVDKTNYKFCSVCALQQIFEGHPIADCKMYLVKIKTDMPDFDKDLNDRVENYICLKCGNQQYIATKQAMERFLSKAQYIEDKP